MRLHFINNIGFILLAIYLILVGITGLFAAAAAIPFIGIIMGVLALVAGIFILIGR